MKGLPRSLARGKGKTTVRKHLVKFKDVPIAVAVASGVGFGTAVVGDFPEGNILYLGAVSYAQFTSADIDDTSDLGDYAIGTTPTADATLSGTNANIVASVALGAATSGVSPLVRSTGATAAVLDNTDGSLELNLQLIIDDANISGTADFTAEGWVEVVYAVLGDD